MATKGPIYDPAGDPVVDPMIDPRTGEYAVIAPGHNFKSVTQKISEIVLTSNTPLGWFFGLMVAGAIATGVVIGITWLFLKGVGIWGVTIPGAWGFAIINFVWWIGIGHAGTLISAILLLFKQTWRNSINRFAEAMTIFAVCCAGIFPLIHVGRPWLAYWLFPYPNTMNVWPQFRSPLAWDVFAVSTYATISIVFWYVGMIPDFGTLRDRAEMPFAKYAYGMLSLGWRGSTRHWIRYESASLLLAGLSTPLVLSVHTVISFDFAVAALAGIRPSSRLISWPAPSTPASPWSSRWRSRSASSITSKTWSPCAISTAWRRSCWGPAASSPTATPWRSSCRGTRPATGSSS
jgi:hypothetical protein